MNIEDLKKLTTVRNAIKIQLDGSRQLKMLFVFHSTERSTKQKKNPLETT